MKIQDDRARNVLPSDFNYIDEGFKLTNLPDDYRAASNLQEELQKKDKLKDKFVYRSDIFIKYPVPTLELIGNKLYEYSYVIIVNESKLIKLCDICKCRIFTLDLSVSRAVICTQIFEKDAYSIKASLEFSSYLYNISHHLLDASDDNLNNQPAKMFKLKSKDNNDQQVLGLDLCCKQVIPTELMHGLKHNRDTECEDDVKRNVKTAFMHWHSDNTFKFFKNRSQNQNRCAIQYSFLYLTFFTKKTIAEKKSKLFNLLKTEKRSHLQDAASSLLGNDSKKENRPIRARHG